MSLGSSDMAGSALGTASSLLLLASIIQGSHNVEVFHYEKMTVLAGQNVTLPCSVKSNDLRMVSVEWRKMTDENTKLALYTPGFGTHHFWPNVSIQTENGSVGSLQLSWVSKWNSGVYVCDLTTYPLGSIRKETQLEVKDVETMCNANSTVEVHAGGNVSIHCLLLPNAQYSWTKDKKHVSGNESLELWQVTEAHTGVYTLAVNTGNQTVHKEFIITLLTELTDLTTLSPQSNRTETDSTQTTDSNLTTSRTTGLPTINTTLTPTMSDFTPSYSNPTLTNNTNITSTPGPHHFNSSTYPELNQTHSLNTSLSDQSAASNLSTTLSYNSTMFSPTQETRNESSGGGARNASYPGPTATQSTRNITIGTVGEGTSVVRSRLVLVLIIILLLLLIAVAGFLYRRRIVKQRMDLPPPFKPPPPPVKYTAARQREIYTRPYPTSRCNSVTELEDVKQSFLI